jgi:hypothetical protein
MNLCRVVFVYLPLNLFSVIACAQTRFPSALAIRPALPSPSQQNSAMNPEKKGAFEATRLWWVHIVVSIAVSL